MPSAESNPYASPQWSDPSPAGLPPALPPVSYDEALFRRNVRIAVACLAPLVLANGWVLARLAPSTMFGVLLFLNIFWLVPALCIAFFWGDRILAWLGSVLHAIAGRNVPLPVWLAVARAALWMLPWAAAAGAMVWAMYLAALVTDRGTPAAYFICPVAGNLLGAWCYVPLLVRWWKTRRHFAPPPG